MRCACSSRNASSGYGRFGEPSARATRKAKAAAQRNPRMTSRSFRPHPAVVEVMVALLDQGTSSSAIRLRVSGARTGQAGQQAIPTMIVHAEHFPIEG